MLPGADFFALPGVLLRYRGLLAHLIHREIHGRVSGTFLGVGWLVLQPLLLLGLYTIVFGLFMQSRWGAQGEGIAHFALALFPGLLVFNLFADCINRAAGLVQQNPNYVKKVVFPLELLIVPLIVASLVQFLIGYAMWLTLVALIKGGVSWSVLLVPLHLAPFVLVIAGLCWALSAVGVYLRDLSTLTPLVTQVLMFMSPVLYPLSNVPQPIRPFLYLNPLTLVVEAVRGSAMQAQTPTFTWWAHLAYWGVAVVLAWLGLKVFTGLRPGFADVV